MSYQKTSWAEFARSKSIQTKKVGKPKNKKCKIHSLQPSLELSASKNCMKHGKTSAEVQLMGISKIKSSKDKTLRLFQTAHQWSLIALHKCSKLTGLKMLLKFYVCNLIDLIIKMAILLSTSIKSHWKRLFISIGLCFRILREAKKFKGK